MAKRKPEKKAGDTHLFYLSDNPVVIDFINAQSNVNEGIRLAIEMFVEQFGEIDVQSSVPSGRNPERPSDVIPFLEMANKVKSAKATKPYNAPSANVHREEVIDSNANKVISKPAENSEVTNRLNYQKTTSNNGAQQHSGEDGVDKVESGEQSGGMEELPQELPSESIEKNGPNALEEELAEHHENTDINNNEHQFINDKSDEDGEEDGEGLPSWMFSS
ncbi:hypothetical protein [Pontibacillus halophilus]|uniref:hypothetical protein n=1 Tax=Pontibacillus halophilus TaxID=516704 RepID=UPI0004051E94|nr:hypothetical protein [Pontibacillus halophilus]